jgi:hypothetical protein
MTIINRFERSCGTFKRGGKKPIVVNAHSINIDHGVDVNTVMIM